MPRLASLADYSFRSNGFAKYGGEHVTMQGLTIFLRWAATVVLLILNVSRELLFVFEFDEALFAFE